MRSVDIIDEKLSIAKEFGATHTINAKERDPGREILDITGGEGVDVAFEAAGLPDTLNKCLESVKAGGKVVLVGLMPATATVPIYPASIVRREIEILGSIGGRPRVDFPVIFKLAERGSLKIDELITKRWRLEEINEAFESLKRGEVIRSLVIP